MEYYINVYYYLGCNSGRRMSSPSELRRDDGPITSAVPDNSSTKKKLLPCPPRHNHFSSHLRTRVCSRLKQNTTCFLKAPNPTHPVLTLTINKKKPPSPINPNKILVGKLRNVVVSILGW